MRNEEGRAFIYTWEARATPLGCFPSVNHKADIEHLKEGGALLRVLVRF
jgi:lipoate-protein ligase A